MIGYRLDEIDSKPVSTSGLCPTRSRGKSGDPDQGFIGESKTHRVYLLYVTDVEKLKNLALTLDWAKALRGGNGKRRLVFAPTKYLDQDHLDKYRIDYAQLPYEIYGLVR